MDPGAKSFVVVPEQLPRGCVGHLHEYGLWSQLQPASLPSSRTASAIRLPIAIPWGHCCSAKR